MTPLRSLHKSLAARLVLAFILVAVPPMLIASHVATRLVNSAANENIGRWLHEASRYLSHTVKETEEEIGAAHVLLRPRFAKNEIRFTPEELQALPGLDVDCVVLTDGAGRVLFTSPGVRSLDETPLYPGSSFRWLTMDNGDRELAIVARRAFKAEDGGERVLDLASLFTVRLSEGGGEEPFEMRIFLPQDGGFRQAYSSASAGSYTLPPAALRAMNQGAREYAVLNADWTDDSPDLYFLFTPVRDAQGGILAVFAVSAQMFSREGKLPGYYALFWSFFVGGTLLSGCSGYLLARRLTRPIRRLNQGVRDIASGRFTGRVDVRGSDEVAELSEGFNLMAGQLELMQRESVQSARQERSRMLGEIALGFAHEIRNPLLVIKTSAELVHGTLPEEGKESRLLGFVVEEVARIDSLVTEFLSFAKPAPLKLDYFRLDSLARDVLELSAAEFAARGIVSSFSDETPGPESTRVLGEENKIRQVLLNLALNAMDAMPQGGALSLRLYRPENGAQLCLEMADTGTGIPPELLPTIHLPFISTKKSGLGLGLAKAYAIIEEHGGSITCESAPGRTVFTVCLNA